MPERKKRVYDFSQPAYSSAGKENFAYKIDFRLDFKDYERSIREMRRSIKELNQSTRDLTKKLNKTNKGYGVYISADQVSSRSGFGNELISFELPNADEYSAELAPFLKEVGEMGRDIMKRKYATRRETGLMNSEVRYRQRRPGEGFAGVEIGWVRRWHRYFGYQEEGAGNIPPMRAILRTSMELQGKDEEIKQVYSKYFRKIFLEKGKNS
jgi:hypothetical protein